MAWDAPFPRDDASKGFRRPRDQQERCRNDGTRREQWKRPMSRLGPKAEKLGLSTTGPLYTRRQTSLPNKFTSALAQTRSCGHLHKFEEGRKLLARSVSPNHHHRHAGLRRPVKRGAHVALQASAATDVRREQNEIAPNVEDHGADQRSPRWVYRRSPVLSS